jgi:hypothetical protein
MIDEILGRYGLEMTWSIKKGIMGKGEQSRTLLRTSQA